MTGTRTATRRRAVVLVVLLLLAALAATLVLTLRPGPAVDAEPGDSPTSSAAPAPGRPAPGSGVAPDAETPDTETPDTETPRPTPSTPDAQDTRDQNDDTPDVPLQWDGRAGGALTVSGSLWGEVTVVPGDSGTRTITVRNDGPTDGTLTASIVNATAFRDMDDPRWIDDAFYDDLTINGITAATLEGMRTPVHHVELARGATAEIPLSFAFDGWSGNRTGGGLEEPSGVIVNPDGVGPRVFTFDVLLRISGDTPDPGAQSSGQGYAPAGDLVDGNVTHTGGATLPDDMPWLLLLAAVLVVVAASAARALGRRPVGQSEEDRG